MNAKKCTPFTLSLLLLFTPLALLAQSDNLLPTNTLTPTAIPIAGTYTSAQVVTLRTQEWLSIHYTLNDTAPTCTTGTTYTAPIAITSTKTIKAISCYTNVPLSAVASFAYVITPGAPPAPIPVPPTALPLPANGAVNVPINTNLRWPTAVPDPLLVGSAFHMYFVYLGTTATLGEAHFKGALVTNLYTPPKPLAYNTKYYWRVDRPLERTTGAVWSFTTQSSPTARSCTLDGVTVVHNASRVFYNTSSVAHPLTCASRSISRRCTDGTLSGAVTYNKATCTITGNTPPPQASIPNPTNASTSVSTHQRLSWNTIPNTRYGVYFGTTATLGSAQYKGTLTSPAYNPPTLSLGTTYYWRIDTRNSFATTTGVVWRFTTKAPGSCVLDGVTVAHNASRLFYSVSTVNPPVTCASRSLSRMCNNGTLSGAVTYNKANCVIQDITAPTISITAPPAGNVSGTLNITATANDNVGVAGVQFKIDNVNINAEDTTAPYSTSWNTATASNGSHRIDAVARDAAGNRATSTRTVTVSNTYAAPTATPVPGTYTTAQNVTLSASGSTSRRYTIDGTMPTCTSGLIYANPIAVATTKTIKAIACYPTGSSAVASFAYVITPLDTTAPTVAFTAPAPSASVSGAITLSANATDAVGVAGLTFKSDMNTVVGTEDTTAPYSVSLNTATLPNGSLTLYAVARDAAGNKATSTRTVTVSNTTADTTPPSIPTALTATPFSSTQINLAWTASTDNVAVTGYKVFRDNAQIAITTTPTYQNTGLTASSTYSYAISAYDWAGNMSARSGTTTQVTLPDTTSTILSSLPIPGTYTTSQSVTLVASSTNIRYTLTGKVPTCAVGTLYGNPITVSSSTIIRAIACNGVVRQSAVVSFPYDIIVAGPVYGGRIVVPYPAIATSTILSPVIVDLQTYLQRMSGVEFHIGTHTAAPGITLMLTNYPDVPSDAKAQLQGRGSDAFVIRGNATQLKIIANNEVGLSHGVYFYLEQLGVRWLMSGDNWTIMPSRSNVTLTIDRMIIPDFFARWYAGTGGFSSYHLGGWNWGYVARADVTRLSGTYQNLLKKTAWNRRMRYPGQGLGSATGESFITEHAAPYPDPNPARPGNHTLQEHPEYLAKIDGLYSNLYYPRPNGQYYFNSANNRYELAVPANTGTHGLNVTTKLNAGNPNAVKLFCEWRINNFRRQRNGPDGTRFQTLSVEPSDGNGDGNNYAELRAQGVGDGSESDQQFFIGNACARMVRAEFPDTSVVMLAYVNRSDPPSFPLERNFIIQPAFAFRTGKKTAHLNNDEWIALWKTKAPRMGVYDYWSIPDWTHEEPSFNYLAMPQKLRAWYGNNIKGLNSESSYGNGAMGFAHYIAQHLMWDINANDSLLREEWYTLAFGRAKPPMKRMLERWATSYLPISSELATSYIDIDEAERLAAGNPAVQARVDDYAKYLHYLRLRNELLNATSTATKIQAGRRLATHLFSINESQMVQTGRIFDLDIVGNPALAPLVEEFNLIDPLHPGPGWAGVHTLSHNEVLALIANGKAVYPNPDYITRTFNGFLVPVAPISWTPPTGDPWGTAMWNSRGAQSISLQMLPGMNTFHFRVSRGVAQSMKITNSAGAVVYRRDITKAPGTPAEALAVWDEMNIPLATGHYKIILGGGVYKFATWRGTPLIMGKITVTGSGSPKLYFYVPSGLRKIALYFPSTYYPTTSWPNKVYMPDGTPATIENRDNGKVMVVTVPPGQDGKIWSINQLLQATYPVVPLNFPDAFSLERSVLMVPSSALNTSGAAISSGRSDIESLSESSDVSSDESTTSNIDIFTQSLPQEADTWSYRIPDRILYPELE